MQPFVEIKRPEKSDHGPARQSQLSGEIRVGTAAPGERVAIDRVRDDGYLFGRNAAGDDIASQSLADDRNRIGALHHKRLETPRRMVAQIGLAVGVRTRPGILPERPDFINDRQPVPAPGANCRQSVQERGVRMQDIGPDLANDLVEPAPQIADDRKLAGRGQPGRESGRLRRAEKLPIADPLACRHRLGFRHEGVDVYRSSRAPGPSRLPAAD